MTTRLTGQHCVLTSGDTGAGKSTTLHFLAGSSCHGAKQRTCEESDPGNCAETEYILCNPPLPGSDIGSSATQSKTRVVVDHALEGCSFLDTPGSKDSNGTEQEIANGVAISNAADACQTLRVLILINLHDLGSARALALDQLAEMLTQYYTPIADYWPAMNILFTHSEGNRTKSLHDIKKVLIEEVNTKANPSNLDLTFFYKQLLSYVVLHGEKVLLRPVRRTGEEWFAPDTYLRLIKDSGRVQLARKQLPISNTAKIAISDQCRHLDSVLSMALKHQEWPLLEAGLSLLQASFKRIGSPCFDATYQKLNDRLGHRMGLLQNEAMQQLQAEDFAGAASRLAVMKEIEGALRPHLSQDARHAAQVLQDHLNFRVQAAGLAARDLVSSPVSALTLLARLEAAATLVELSSEYQQEFNKSRRVLEDRFQNAKDCALDILAHLERLDLHVVVSRPAFVEQQGLLVCATTQADLRNQLTLQEMTNLTSDGLLNYTALASRLHTLAMHLHALQAVHQAEVRLSTRDEYPVLIARLQLLISSFVQNLECLRDLGTWQKVDYLFRSLPVFRSKLAVIAQLHECTELSLHLDAQQQTVYPDLYSSLRSIGDTRLAVITHASQVSGVRLDFDALVPAIRTVAYLAWLAPWLQADLTVPIERSLDAIIIHTHHLNQQTQETLQLARVVSSRQHYVTLQAQLSQLQALLPISAFLRQDCPSEYYSSAVESLTMDLRKLCEKISSQASRVAMAPSSSALALLADMRPALSFLDQSRVKGLLLEVHNAVERRVLSYQTVMQKDYSTDALHFFADQALAEMKQEEEGNDDHHTPVSVEQEIFLLNNDLSQTVKQLKMLRDSAQDTTVETLLLRRLCFISLRRSELFLTQYCDEFVLAFADGCAQWYKILQGAKDGLGEHLETYLDGFLQNARGALRGGGGSTDFTSMHRELTLARSLDWAAVLRAPWVKEALNAFLPEVHAEVKARLDSVKVWLKLPKHNEMVLNELDVLRTAVPLDTDFVFFNGYLESTITELLEELANAESELPKIVSALLEAGKYAELARNLRGQSEEVRRDFDDVLSEFFSYKVIAGIEADSLFRFDLANQQEDRDFIQKAFKLMSNFASAECLQPFMSYELNVGIEPVRMRVEKIWAGLTKPLENKLRKYDFQGADDILKESFAYSQFDRFFRIASAEPDQAENKDEEGSQSVKLEPTQRGYFEHNNKKRVQQVASFLSGLVDKVNKDLEMEATVSGRVQCVTKYVNTLLTSLANADDLVMLPQLANLGLIRISINQRLDKEWDDMINAISRAFQEIDADLARKHINRMEECLLPAFMPADEKRAYEIQEVKVNLNAIPVDTTDAKRTKLSLDESLNRGKLQNIKNILNKLVEELGVKSTEAMTLLRGEGRDWTGATKHVVPPLFSRLNAFINVLGVTEFYGPWVKKLADMQEEARMTLKDKLMNIAKEIEHARQRGDLPLIRQLVRYLEGALAEKMLGEQEQKEQEKELESHRTANNEQLNVWAQASEVLHNLTWSGQLQAETIVNSLLTLKKSNIDSITDSRIFSFQQAVRHLKTSLLQAIELTVGNAQGSFRDTEYNTLRLLRSNLNALKLYLQDADMDKAESLTPLFELCNMQARSLDTSIKDIINHALAKAEEFLDTKNFKDLENEWEKLRELYARFKNNNEIFAADPTITFTERIKDTMLGWNKDQFDLGPTTEKSVAALICKQKMYVSNLSDVDLASHIHKSISTVLQFYTDKPNFSLVTLGTLLSEESRCAEVINEHPEFRGLLTQLLNQVFGDITPGDALKKFSDLNPNITTEETDTLLRLHNLYERSYENVIERYMFQSVNSADVSKLVEDLHRLGSNLASKNARTNWNEIPDLMTTLLGNIAGLWSMWGSKDSNAKSHDKLQIQKPNVIQVLSLLRMLGLDANQTRVQQTFQAGQWRKQLQSHMAQVVTGGGKSIILGMLASSLALLDCEVYCANYNEYLSDRDRMDFKPFFELLKVSELITYSTLKQLAEKLINKDGNIRELTENFIRKKRVQLQQQATGVDRPWILLLDESDMLFVPSYHDSTYNPMFWLKDDIFQQLLREIWNQGNPVQDEAQVRNTNAYKAAVYNFPQLTTLIEMSVEEMMKDAIEYNSPPYEVILEEGKNRIGYLEDAGVNVRAVHGYRTAFAYLHELGQGKVSEDVVNENIGLSVLCGRFSYAEIPKNFTTILAVTGTGDAMTAYEKGKMESYNIKSKTITPSPFGDRRLKVLSTRVLFDEPAFFHALQMEIGERAKRGQPVLVYFHTNAQLDKFRESDYGAGLHNLQVVKENTYNLNFRIKQAMLPGRITLMPESLGRGLDFFYADKDIDNVGGAHLIVAFYPDSSALQIQLMGRVARQQKEGSARIIVLAQDLTVFGLTLDQIKASADSGKDGDIDHELATARERCANEIEQLRNDQLASSVRMHEDSLQQARRLQQVMLRNQRWFDILDLFQKQIVREILSFLETQAASSQSLAKPLHWLLIVDQSPSMSLRDLIAANPDPVAEGVTWEKSRIGAVLEQIYGFIKKRSEIPDWYSLVCFHSSGHIKFAGERFGGNAGVRKARDILHAITTSPGGTNFVAGFNMAEEVLRKVGAKVKKTNILFLSDGESNTDAGEAIDRILQTYPETIIWTVKFSADGDGATLKKIADRGNGEYVEVLTDVALLGEAFEKMPQAARYT
eukprot:gb/GEZN01000048.1/.p1 GENE.gb/GEZN01000048.1/~~gb/GEZN01000048.1/.p1  ORF type:complete len:2943 (+),score=416.90 gb/GEZN01000048.1/:766-8829(+)